MKRSRLLIVLGVLLMTASGCNGPSEVPTEEWANEVRDAVRQHVEGSHEVPIFRVKVHNPDLEKTVERGDLEALFALSNITIVDEQIKRRTSGGWIIQTDKGELYIGEYDGGVCSVNMIQFRFNTRPVILLEGFEVAKTPRLR